MYARLLHFLPTICLVLFSTVSTLAQQHSNLTLFNLKEVSLRKSVFKEAMYTDLDYILELNTDRLLAPFLLEAGLEPKAKPYPNWENSGLNGHIGGHYLTALAQMIASTENEKARERLKYTLQELKRVQVANGNGYIGGVPESKRIWSEISKGEINADNFSLNSGWVPLYNIHKTFAGLRDVYLILGNEQAKKMLIQFTDWMVETTSALSDAQVQELLVSEHGGLNEVFADVYQITGKKKYLRLAYRFSHQYLLNAMKNKNDILNGMHANTQIPKVIGFETIASADKNKNYHEAAMFFWDNVANYRSVSIGGNSVREHFHPRDDFSGMVNSVQGPETCNTYNMLKLSKKLFLSEADEKYIHFYEQALYNHILSSQHPDGGFVYFTPMRPGHYRVYSQPQTSFWCCVGSGMENHGKYNEFIYAHNKRELFVNLFIPSVVYWKEKGIKLEQTTTFPHEELTTFTVHAKKPTEFQLQMRYPEWATKNYRIFINGEEQQINAKPGSFISIKRIWTNGDKITVHLPMELRSVKLPDGSNYRSFMYGPLVLGTRMGKDNMKGVFADDSRGGHIAEGELMPFSEAPVLVTDQPDSIIRNLKPSKEKNLTFLISEGLADNYEQLRWEPFYMIHEERYAVYVPVVTPAFYQEEKQVRKKNEQRTRKLQNLTIDYVSPGEQQPESDHFIQSNHSETGIYKNRHWRDATGWFSYQLRDEKREAEQVRITYYGKDTDRHFTVFVNEQPIAEEQFQGKQGDIFFTKDYRLPQKIREENKTTFRICFKAMDGSRTAGIYGVRLMKNN